MKPVGGNGRSAGFTSCDIAIDGRLIALEGRNKIRMTSQNEKIDKDIFASFNVFFETAKGIEKAEQPFRGKASKPPAVKGIDCSPSTSGYLTTWLIAEPSPEKAVALTVPATSSFWAGAVVPMPTLPDVEILIPSALLVARTNEPLKA